MKFLYNIYYFVMGKKFDSGDNPCGGPCNPHGGWPGPAAPSCIQVAFALVVLGGLSVAGAVAGIVWCVNTFLIA